jgi:hypothetical protein
LSRRPIRKDEPESESLNGLAAVKTEGKYGYINEQGKIIIPPRFALIRNFAANGLAAVRVEGKWGYIRAPSK